MASNPEIPSFKNPQGGLTPGQGASASKGPAPKDGESGGPAAGPKAAPAAEKKEEKKGGGVPLFSKAASAPKMPNIVSPAPGPSLKIRGLAGGPRTLFDRLKQFQKKDLIFIASGLGVLFMAPLAEHFMMSPTQDKNLQPGFSQPGSGSFNGEVGPHEPGTGLMAPGGLIGGSADVITPLNVRDPSALVMAPGASQVQPPPSATTVAPPAASSSRESGWKDALSGAAKAGVEKGADAAKPGAFRAPGSMAGALRGLSALSGGSYGGGPSFNLSAPNASNVPNRSGEGSRLSQVKSADGYKGVGARGIDSGGGAEAMRKGAEGAGDRFNRPGGAAGNLEAAAKEAIPLGGGTGGAGPGSGGENKGGSGSNSKDNKALGESLAYLRMKMEMEKEMDLKWSKKKWKEFEFPKMIYEEITKSAIQNLIGKGLFEPFGKALASTINDASGKSGRVQCWIDPNAKAGDPPDFDQTDNDESTIKMQGKNVVYCKRSDPSNCTAVGGAPPSGWGRCAQVGGDAKPAGAADDRRQPPSQAPGSGNSDQQRAELGKTRKELQDYLDKSCGAAAASNGATTSTVSNSQSCATGKAIMEEYKNIDKASQMTQESEAALKRSWPEMQSAVAKMKTANGHMQDALTVFGHDTDTEQGNSVLSKGLQASKKLKEEVDPAMKLPAPPPPATDHPAKKPLDGAVQIMADAKTRWGEGDKLLAQAKDQDGFESIGQAIANAKGALDTGDEKARASGKLLYETNGRLDGMSTAGAAADQLGNFVSRAKNEVTRAQGPLRPLAGDAVATQGAGDIGGQLRAARSALDQRVLGARDSVCGALCGSQAAPKSGFNPPPPEKGKDAYAVSRVAADGGVGKIGGQAKQGGPPVTIPDTIEGYKQLGAANQTKLNNAIAAAKTPDQLKAMETTIKNADQFLKANTGCVASSNCGYAGSGGGATGAPAAENPPAAASMEGHDMPAQTDGN